MRIALLYLCLAAARLTAGPILFAIGGDANHVITQLTAIDAGTGAYGVMGTLGDGTTDFGGGMISLGSDTFIGFQSVGGQASLAAYDLAGTYFGAPVGNFFPGGLAFDMDAVKFYWIENYNNLTWTLMVADTTNDTGTPVLSGAGLASGLALGPTPGMLYALISDISSMTHLVAIDPTVPGIADSFPMGPVFYGGVAWDPVGMIWYLLQGDLGNGPTMHFYTPQGTLGALFHMPGTGGHWGSLAIALDEVEIPSGVPEPSSGALLLCGLALAGLAKRVHRARR